MRPMPITAPASINLVPPRSTPRPRLNPWPEILDTSFKAILAQTTSILRETGDIKKEGNTMKSNHFPVLVVVLIIALSLCLSVPASAADSTSFDPTKVQVKAAAVGVPIGTIVAWPVEKNPADWHKWLECNGQTIDPQVYPELADLVGPTVPDLRGLFLRGLGGKSDQLSRKQLEGVYISNASFSITGIYKSSIEGYSVISFNCANRICPDVSAIGQTPVDGNFTLNSGSSETRPENMAVRYLIKALK